MIPIPIIVHVNSIDEWKYVEPILFKTIDLPYQDRSSMFYKNKINCICSMPGFVGYEEKKYFSDRISPHFSYGNRIYSFQEFYDLVNPVKYNIKDIESNLDIIASKLT